ncbi:adenylate/guanylate cyclase domain-containing protein [Olivibacter sp. SDN3]|uniref:adenylate/guanylate cyclase domain-containing protein n=1 Tax=Olivibacter sp. SDN3 TaxID=2764720 RepID=UPI0016512C21|nr:adenylate/guanylate cyclase domain-containing protein [Olivibacter sp. SDN3]QNL48195.1 adenylate/guanylate cyclase domain-containing protein [Olivibacter sp. SDN3]
MANNLIGIILYLHAKSIDQVFGLQLQYRTGSMFMLFTLLGILYGSLLGATEYYLDKYRLGKMALGSVILAKALLSLLMIIVIIAILSAVSVEINVPYTIPGDSPANFLSRKYIIYLFLLYYLLMTLLIGFINQVNKKYGPGVLIPLVLGKYRRPVEEMRVFMFMDLKSSTTIAEILGHIRYSSFIRDSLYDINQVLPAYNAEVYQYVGDEVVVSWRIDRDMQYDRCALFFFACRSQFLKRLDYYKENYGFFPEFKAGLHMGVVTAVEIGDIKRDIAYHGDTINTTARIQSVCNHFDKDFLASSQMVRQVGLEDHFKTQPLGMIKLKGKSSEIGITSIEGTLD